MDSLPWLLRMCVSLYAHALLLPWGASFALTFGNETDRAALTAFKNGITHDPLGVMNSWNDSTHFCEWTGVTCGSYSRRVVILSLEGQQLVGSISPSIGNLSFLAGINLKMNNLNGKIPSEFGRLLSLRHLNLSDNFLTGEIPLNLTQCIELRVFTVDNNALTGYIPHQLSYLNKLVILVLGKNNLTGTIPSSLGNITSLYALSLGLNRLQGSIPNDLGRLSRLGFFTAFSNMLSGTIPPSLYNISSIYYFTVADNQLQGSLPPNVGLTLPNLEIFAGGVNYFHGPFPDSISNASQLRVLDFAENGFTGSLPMNIGILKNLVRLNFGSNRLGSGEANGLNVITSMANCTQLEVLGLDGNRLRGELPESVGNLSTHLSILTIGSNLIHGTLPMGIENLVNLTLLGLEGNFFTGSVPFGIGKLEKLGGMHINYNRLSGAIPTSLGNLTLLNSLYMQGNGFEGGIPTTLGECQKLIALDISYNNLSGAIPKEVLRLSSLSIFLSVAHNSLSGSLPLEVGSLMSLEELDISENRLSGQIPVTLAECRSLETLKMGGNLFQGIIPKALEALKGLQVMDLAHNNLSGQIPDFLQTFGSLKYLNLSLNALSGKVPKEGIFKNASEIAVHGNQKLCGGVAQLQLPPCKAQALQKSGQRISNRLIVSLTIGILFLVLLSTAGTVYWLRNFKKRSPATSTPSFGEWKLCVSYSDIFRSTNGFSSDSLIGEGSFGSVYKGVFSDGDTLYAIKVLKLQTQGASESFIAECQTLKNIIHRNLIKIISACSSLDSKGNDFKALIYEFMTNGSLEQWLHPNSSDKERTKSLSLIQRLNIAVDVAYGLEYLHCYCGEPMVHCDIKPTNILLDSDMVAHIGDFGLARFLVERNKLPTSGLKGSIGYIPPEYGTGGQVSTEGDMYSYGILLLELFTAKKPTDEMFKDGLSLYDFVKMASPDQILEIVDPLLLLDPYEEEDGGGGEEDGGGGDPKGSKETLVVGRRNMEHRTGECLCSVIMIGLSCCAPSPKDRMAANVIVSKMAALRESYRHISLIDQKKCM